MAASKAPRSDLQEIARSLGVLHLAGDVTEMRIPKTEHEGTVSGYFNDHAALAKQLAARNGDAAVYVTLNPVAPALLARCANRIKSRVRTTTGDKDIARRLWILIDCDPVRPAEISSTDAEHQAALERARDIRYVLSEEGWPEPVLADSGNGCHLLYGLNLPNDDASTELVKAVLKALAARFSDAAVKVDESVYNAARIVKAYGTVACKGDNLPERPHRLSRILDAPSRVEPVPRQLLEEMAASAPKPAAAPRPAPHTGGRTGRFDLEGFLARHLEAREPVAYDGGRMWRVDCPFNEEHHAPDAAVFERADGSLGFKCLHDSCRDKNWRAVRELFEGPRPQWNPPKPEPPADEGRWEPQAEIVRKFCHQLQLAGGLSAEDVRAATRIFNQHCASPLDAAQVDAIVDWTLKNIRSGAGGGQTTASAAVEKPESLPAFPEIGWRGVFKDYRAAMEGTTEACDASHFITLWSAAAVGLGRKVEMHAGDVVYANAYLCNFGETGDKKTTGQRRLTQCKLLEHWPQILLVPGVGSTEGFADELTKAETGVCLFMWEEFATFLSQARWSGSTLLQFITECFDCPAEYTKLYRNKPIHLESPTLSILTATTTEWFWKHAKAEDFFGGFGNRFLFFTGARKALLPNPRMFDIEVIDRIKDHLKIAADRPSCRAEWTTDARKAWNAFYLKFEGASAERSGLLRAATKRAHVYVRKLAMTYAALEQTLPHIDKEQLEAAIAVVEYSVKCTERLLDLQAVSSKPQAELEQRFLRYVAKHPGERVRRLQQKMARYCGDAETFNRVLKSLVQADRIVIVDKCACPA